LLSGALNCNVKPACGHRRRFSDDDRGNPKIGEGPSNDPARVRQKPRAIFQVLLGGRDFGDEFKRVVLQDVGALVVRPQVVNLLPVKGYPKVLANELDRVQLVLETWGFFEQPFDNPVARVEPDKLEF